MLDVVDVAFARRLGPECPAAVRLERRASCVTPATAINTLEAAIGAKLRQYQAACSSYIGSHISEVVASLPLSPEEGVLEPMLRQAAALETETEAVMSAARSLSAGLRATLPVGQVGRDVLAAAHRSRDVCCCLDALDKALAQEDELRRRGVYFF